LDLWAANAAALGHCRSNCVVAILIKHDRHQKNQTNWQKDTSKIKKFINKATTKSLGHSIETTASHASANSSMVA
jgi:hypothetical protein